MALAVLDLNKAIEFSQADFTAGQYTEDELDLLQTSSTGACRCGRTSRRSPPRATAGTRCTTRPTRRCCRQGLHRTGGTTRPPRLPGKAHISRQHTADLRRHPGRAAGRGAHREPRPAGRLRGGPRAGRHDRAAVHGVEGRDRPQPDGPPGMCGQGPLRPDRRQGLVGPRHGLPARSTSSTSRATCGWAGAQSDYRSLDWAMYSYLMTPEAIFAEYGLVTTERKDQDGQLVPVPAARRRVRFVDDGPARDVVGWPDRGHGLLVSPAQVRVRRPRRQGGAGHPRHVERASSSATGSSRT